MVHDAAANANSFKIPILHAGEYCHSQHCQSRIHAVGCINRSPQHLSTSGCMDSDHCRAQLGSLATGGGHSRRNVVIFQIEKNAASGGHEVTHDSGPFRRKELHADLVCQSGIAHGCHDVLGRSRR